MKNTIFILTWLLLVVAGETQLHAHTVRKDATGNYYAIKPTPESNATATGKLYLDLKGNSYPVFLSKSGKPFVIMISKKTGNEYRKYLAEK